LGLSKDQLAVHGALLGSDVPFCLTGGTALAQGRGEILTALPALPEVWLVLVTPPLAVSTAEIYRGYEAALVFQRPDTAAMTQAVRAGQLGGITACLANVLESVTFPRFPVVRQIKGLLEDCGAVRALMSGSGPTVFGIAPDRMGAQKIVDCLRPRLPGMFIETTRTWPPTEQDFSANEENTT
jgi:4-diphosphocytidyl-2-C-methyl-D-erythritol kinase